MPTGEHKQHAVRVSQRTARLGRGGEASVTAADRDTTAHATSRAAATLMRNAREQCGWGTVRGPWFLPLVECHPAPVEALSNASRAADADIQAAASLSTQLQRGSCTRMPLLGRSFDWSLMRLAAHQFRDVSVFFRVCFLFLALPFCVRLLAFCFCPACRAPS